MGCIVKFHIGEGGGLTGSLLKIFLEMKFYKYEIRNSTQFMFSDKT